MTDKEKILAEIERLCNRAERHVALESEGLKAGDTRTYEDGLADAYDIMCNFINSLPEEPVSEDLGNAADKYCCNICNIVEFTEGDSEEEASDREYVERAFKAGAQWQKGKVADVVKQYSDKGEKNYQDSYVNDGKCSTSTCYWDGYRDCANGINRELED